jgi:hypothetical protein
VQIAQFSERRTDLTRSLCTVLYDSSIGEFTLTGIGKQFLLGMTTPKDAGKAFAGVPRRDTKGFTKIYQQRPDLDWWTDSPKESYKKRDWRHLPIGIHMSCWKLAQWIIGPGIAENLELFIAIALQTTFETLTELRGRSLPHNIYELVALKNSPYGTYMWQFG